jgi:hypothetical protein
VVEEWASYDLLWAMRQLGTIPDPGQEEARAPAEEREVKGLIDKAKGRINEAGGTKDNVRDELDEATGRGRRERGPQGGHPRGSEAAWLRGGQGQCPGRVGRLARASLAGNSQSAKPRPGLWASRVNFARMEFSEVRPPWGWAAHTALYLADRPTSGYRGCLGCLAKKVVGNPYDGETTYGQS